MKWWMEHRFRMIQNNLRDIDADLDIDMEIKKLKEFGADVVQIGCGGISAFSPSGLDCQVPSPYLKNDMFGTLVERCHDNGIKVIARFDVSKVHESLGDIHPEWLSRRADGSAICFNDTVAACINGGYQQVEALEIIKEILGKYPVDGIFFNMFGYQTRDYDNRYVGICQCENCKRRFLGMYGEMLPTEENEDDPIYRRYREFKEYTVRDILEKIRRTIDSVNPEIALSTYSGHCVDIVRTESNSALDRPYPFWIYSASDNTASVEGTFPGKVSSNCAINAVDIPYRFMGVSPFLNQIRLYQNMANGSNLDWCIIGAFEDYPDRKNYDGVKEVFRFQKRYQAYFDNLRSDAGVLLVQPNPPYETQFSSEYRGVFRMLKEAHIQFDVIMQDGLDMAAEHLEQYKLIILPGIEDVDSRNFAQALKSSDAVILATGCSFRHNGTLLKELFGQALAEKVEPVRGSYILTQPKDMFQSFQEQDWIYMDREFYRMQGEGNAILPYVSAAMYGPPERCFGHEVTEIPGGTIYKEKNIYLPWQPGTLYYQHGYEAFKDIILDIIRNMGCLEDDFIVTAHKSLEVFYGPCGKGQYLLQMINLSGFNGTTVWEPISQQAGFGWTGRIPDRIWELGQEGAVLQEGTDKLVISSIGTYRAYLIEFGQEGKDR
ncbi:hypothetical protein MCJ35_02545 [Enterocloster sp. OA13]|uniref:alpha-amylase family protein n=1 Tax=Enterocloster sp. OA13 TaxID=2914161 RepID=UPI00046FA2A5|nr:hypothetical protein [Enterocloster sp. OA13]